MGLDKSLLDTEVAAYSYTGPKRRAYHGVTVSRLRLALMLEPIEN